MNILRYIYHFILLVIYIPIWPLCIIGYYRHKEFVESDLRRINPQGGLQNLIKVLLRNKPFRNVFFYRIGTLGKIISLYMHPLSSLYITTNIIGKGLIVVHGDSTYINAEKIGDNCYVNQNVTIGVIGNNKPVLGDNVRVATGAIVIGGITIGNNVVIAAGAVVVKDVPDNCMVAGNPSCIRKLNGKSVNIKL